ncbi:MAG: DUF981 family protein [Armatimonadota bacterium]
MFIDYITLMLINMAAGFLILAFYVYKGYGEQDQAHWAPAFGITGFVALMNGFNMSWNWPLPGSYNCAFGDMSVLFGVLMAGAALALAFGWRLMPLGIYAFFAGLAAVLTGVRFIHLSLTAQPMLSGAGFVISGLCGMLAPLLLYKPTREYRLLGAGALGLASLIWALTGYTGYWIHLQMFSKWVPLLMR